MTDRMDAQVNLNDASTGFEPTVFAYAADLIRVYPNGSPQQLQALIDVYPRLSALDIAHLLSDRELASKLEQFGREHKSTTRTPLREYVLFLVIAVFSLGVIFWTLVVAK